MAVPNVNTRVTCGPGATGYRPRGYRLQGLQATGATGYRGYRRGENPQTFLL